MVEQLVRFSPPRFILADSIPEVTAKCGPRIEFPAEEFNATPSRAS